MSQFGNSIITTGAAAIIGQGIIRSLRIAAVDYRIVGIDRSVNDYSVSLCNAYHRKAYQEDNPNYLPWLRSLVEQERVSLIVPGIEEDVFFLHDHRKTWQDWPVKIVLSSASAIEAGRDKWLLYELLLQHHLPAIPTMAVGEWSDFKQQLGEPPYIVKAKRGSGSRGQMILHTEDDWQQNRYKYGNAHLVQKVVGEDAEEYTVAMFGFGDGTTTALSVLKRTLLNGSTWFAEVMEGDAELESYCTELNRLLTPLGPTNYQLRRDGSTWLVLEINPRISSSTSIRTGFGFNEAAMCVDYYLIQRDPQLGPQRKGRCQRYVTDHFEFE